jgi:hypothetical protein
MRKLQKSERNLLLIFSVAVFLALNLFALRAWLQHRSKVTAKLAESRTALAGAQSWITAAEAIEPVRDWLKEHPAPANTHEGASTELLNLVRNIAEKAELKILEETLLSSDGQKSGRFVVLQTKLGGPFGSVAKFLFELQSPVSWRAVNKMTVRSDNEPPNVVVDMEIRQYYRSAQPPKSKPEP